MLKGEEGGVLGSKRGMDNGDLKVLLLPSKKTRTRHENLLRFCLLLLHASLVLSLPASRYVVSLLYV